MAALSRKTLHARPLRTSEKESIQLPEHEGLLTQWTATTVRCEALDIIVATVYLAPGLGVQGTNWTTLMELADFLYVQGLPFLVAGDYNMEISELQVAGLERFLGAEWVTPKGPVPGGHRAIDLILASTCFKHALDVQWDQNSPWAVPHTGFLVSMPWKALSFQVRVIEAPLDYKAAMGPDRPWEWYVHQAQPAIQEGLRRTEEARRHTIHYSNDVDERYATFLRGRGDGLGPQAG